MGQNILFALNAGGNMEYVKEGEKVNMLVEIIPLIETATGRIISWKIGKCFRLNPPKKQEQKEEQLSQKTKIESVDI